MVFYSVIEMYLNETYSIKNHILLYYFSFSPRFFFPQIQTNNNHPWRMAQLVARPALSFLASSPDPICCMDHPLCVLHESPHPLSLLEPWHLLKNPSATFCSTCSNHALVQQMKNKFYLKQTKTLARLQSPTRQECIHH